LFINIFRLKRRFGENDAQLSLEDKMFLRFQKERVKKARNASIFNLDGAEYSTLTHKGKALSEELFLRFQDSNALPELMLPIFRAMQVLRPQQSPELPLPVKVRHVELLEKLHRRINEVRSSRKHLMWRPIIKKALPSLAPRYSVDFIPKKDLDPDESKVELKQLNRQLKREKKAAMRELRRDADFLDQEKYKETQELTAKRKETYARNFAWMEEQQATINQHVKAGKGLLKGGGSSVLRKKARVKR